MKEPRRYSPESVRTRSDKKVKKAAKKLGGRVTPNSGATKIKGDYSLAAFLVEHKFTDKKSFRLEDQIWEKAVHEAFMSNKEAAIEVETAGAHYFVIAPHVFEQIKDLIDATQNQIL